MSAYYNECDPFAASWLRELITAGLISDGDVDERSIAEVQPTDLVGYTQCHFFAGIGGWSYALRLAGWPDARPVWTGSCPCQPFSAAGKQKGVADDRHLWPHWFRLICECRPDAIFGEQVESAIAHGWLALVCDDLEREGYAIGAVCVPAAGVGAPHRRQRLWFVAEPDGMADTEHPERRPLRLNRVDGCDGAHTGRQKAHGESGTCGKVCRVADSGWPSPTRFREYGGAPTGTDAGRISRRREDLPGSVGLSIIDGHERGTGEAIQRARRWSEGATAGLASGSPWANADWLPCRDSKTRPVESGTFPLAHGVSGRVGRLRGYGNAIVPQVAAEVIKAYMDCDGMAGVTPIRRAK